MQPRIYTYKITFEEVPYYYYGSKKERYYNQKYFGSPITNKWCWELYTPKKQILEVFDYTDEGYEKCKRVEDRLISPFLNDPYCLNERCGGAYSLDIRRKTGKKVGLKHKENGTGVCGISRELRKEIGRKSGIKTKKGGTGIFSLTKEQRREISIRNKENKVGMFSLTKEQKRQIGLKTKENKVGLFSLTKEQRKENSRKAGLKCKENGTGIFSLTVEQKSELGKNAAKKVNSQKWICLETGYISNPGALTNYQKARGIDTTKRKRIN